MPSTEYSEGFSGRLNAALDALDDVVYPPANSGRTVKLAAEFPPLTSAGAGKILSGNSVPRLELILRICDKYNISIEWLLTNQGPMFCAPSKINYLLVGEILESIELKCKEYNFNLTSEQKSEVAELCYVHNPTALTPDDSASTGILFDFVHKQNL